MAVPTITLLNHQLLDAADVNTNWNDLTTADPDIKVEGSNSMSGIFRADGEQGYADLGSAPVTAAGATLRGWIFTNNIAYMGTMASDPYKLLAYDGSTTELKNLFGSDTYPGGWFNFIWDMDDFTTLTLANVQRWGIEAGHASNAKNAINTWMDAMRYLDGYSMTGGTSGDKVELDDIATYDKGTTTLRGYGVVTEVSGVYFCTGDVQFGTGATTHYFEMDGEILVFRDENVAAGLYKLSGVGSGTNIVIKNSVIRSAGTTDATRFILDFDEANLSSFSFTDNLIVRSAAVAFKSGQTVTGNIFDDCGQITHGGADMDDCVIKNFQTSGSAALLYDENTDPDGEMDNMAFDKGSATKHAIHFGDTIPASITLRGITFTGYNGSDDQDDSTFYFADTTGTITLNLVGCSGNVSVKTAGCTVTKVVDPVTTTITVLDISTLNPISGARVLAYPADATGPMNYQTSVTQITRSASTATVSQTGHGLSTDDYVYIQGANEPEYNGVHQITVTGVDAYTFTVSGTPDSPATGTITETDVLISDTTDVNGEVTDTRSFSSDQPITGRVREGTNPEPNYKTSPITGTVDNVNGVLITVFLVPD